MGKTQYTINDATVLSTVAGYDNPTLSVEDRRQYQQNVGTPSDDSNAARQLEPTVVHQSRAKREMAEFGEIPHSGRGDYLRFGFLILFPLTLFIVAVVVTGLNV